MSHEANIYKIAEIAGVNVSTVSRALNPATAGMISEKQRKKILAICDKLNYRPQLSARSFVTGKTFKVGLISGAVQSDLGNPPWARFINALLFSLQKHHYNLMLFGIDPEDAQTGNRITECIMSQSADAYVLGSAMVNRNVIDTLAHLPIPIVLVNAHNKLSEDLFSSISPDDTAAYGHFWRRVSPEDYGKILFFGTDSINTTVKFKSFLDAMRQYSTCQSEPEILLRQTRCRDFFFTHSTAFEFAIENISALENRKYIVCSSDLAAIGLTNAFSVLKKPLPVLLGYDNLPQIRAYPIATIDGRYDLMGSTAAEMLLRKLDSKDYSCEHRTVTAEYIPAGNNHDNRV